ncbi:hypothetical protein FSP39_010297 [Pinctada imbricata]|uniref:HEAT repeat-containing protein 1 n=1 Tax=Pinctada imbricata TaxID=66713 RepID=A0AA88XR92_PINIB|nr:hypothetical protein FSP39_010297 [Pinctada imbricata]
MTSLAKQLQRLAVPHTQTIFAEDRRKKSLLFDPKEAAELDKETFYSLGVNGLEELQSLDPVFQQFEDTLFTESSLTFERSVQTKEVNETLNQNIKNFLIFLSPYCLLKPAQKTLEWLVYRFHIHQFNVDELMMCCLPYHESKIFSRVVQLLTLDSKTATKWDWLLPVQKSGIYLPRLTLINHCRTNTGFLSFVCENISKAIKVLTSSREQASKLRTLLAFYVSTVIGVIEQGGVSEGMMAVLLPQIALGLRSKVNDFRAATYMIVAELFHTTKLKSDVVKNLLNAICKRMNGSLVKEALSCILLMFQTQDIDSLTKRSFKHIVRQPGFVHHLCSLVTEFKAEVFLSSIFERLIPAACSLSLEASSGDSSSSETTGHEVNHLEILQSVLSEVQMSGSIADKTIRNILVSYVRYGSTTQNAEHLAQMGEQMKSIVRLLEARYSDSVDKAVKSVLADPQFTEMKSLIQDFLNLSVLSIQHYNMPDSNASLVLSLNHRTSHVRINAVNYLLQNVDKDEDGEFLSDAVLARLSDDSTEVVDAVLTKTGKEIWTKVTNKPRLMDCLLNIVSSRRDDEHSPSLCEKAMETLGACDPDLDEEMLTAILPLLLLYQGDSPNIIGSFLTSNFAQRTPIFQTLKSKFGSSSSANSPKKAQSKKRMKKSVDSTDPVRQNIDVVESIADGLCKLDESEASNIMERLIHKYSATDDIRGRYFVLLLLNSLSSRETPGELRNKYIVDHLRAIKMNCPSPDTSSEGIGVGQETPWSLEMTVSQMYYNVHPATRNMSGLSMLNHLISTIDIPTSLKSNSAFIDYRDDKGEGDRVLYVLVQIFDYITMMSEQGRGYKALCRYVTNHFLQMLSTNQCLVQFLGFLWTLHSHPIREALNFNLVIQAKSLIIGQYHLVSMEKNKLDIKTLNYVITSLLIAITNPHVGIRQSVLRVIESMVTVAMEMDSPFLILINKILKCRAELISDHEYVCLLMRSLLKKLEEEEHVVVSKKRNRRSSKQSRKQIFLDDLMDILVSHDTPTNIQNSLLNILKLVNLKPVFERVLPLLDYHLSHLPMESCSHMEYCLTRSLLEHYTTEISHLLLPTSKPVNILVRAMQCETVCTGTDNIIQTLAIQQITKDLYSELQPEVQQVILSCLFDVWTKAAQPKLATQVKKVVKHLSLDGDHIVSELQSSFKVMSATTVRESKRSKRQSGGDVDSETEGEFDSKSWQRVTVILEAIQDKKKINNHTVILPVMFKVMARVLDSDIHTSAEYIKQLLLSVLYNVCEKAVKAGKPTELIPEQSFNMEMIVNCIRTSENPQTHHHALLVLTMAAKIYPEKLLHNIMSVFTFMGANMLRQDDAYSFHIINRILETVVPALVTVCEQRTKVPRGSTGSSEDVITTVLRVFVDAYPHVPQHRRLMLFTKLLQIVGQRSFLWRCCLLMIEHFVNKPTYSTQSETDKQEDHESYVEFLLGLCGQFSTEEQLLCAADMISYVTKLPDDRQEVSSLISKTVPTSLGKLKKDDTEIFNLKYHTAKQLRHFKYESMQFLTTLFTSSNFIAQMSGSVEEGVVPAFKLVLERVMEYIPRLTKTMESHSDHPTARFWKAMLHKVYELLDKVVVLLPDSMFIEVVSSLMEHSLCNVQRKAMELLNNNLLQLKDNSQSQQVGYLLPVVDKLIIVVERSNIDGEDAENTVNGQTALYSLKLLCRLLGASNPHTFIKVLKLCIQIFTSKGDNLPLSASALLCIAEICNSLKAHVIAHLAAFMPHLVTVMKDQNTLFLNDLYTLSVITTTQKVLENLSLFLTPYLNDIMYQVCMLCTDTRETLQKPQIQQRLKTIRHTLATLLPPRILLPVVTWCYENISAQQIMCLKPLMLVLEEHIVTMEKEDLTSQIQQLQAFFLQCLDLRSMYRKQVPIPQISDVEETVLSTFVSLVMKLSEATFRPILFKLFDWATRDDSTRHRVLVFYRLANRQVLSEKLRSLFTIFAGHIIQHAAQTLDTHNISKKDKTPFGKAKLLTNQLLQYIMDCLYHCFLYDTEGFVNKERFDTLMQPLVDQIENLDKPKFYQSRVVDHLVPCIIQFAVAAQDDSLWKAMNYQILLKTRHNSPKIRYAALTAIDEFHRKFGEDYMPLLPETIPFLAELMEDENEEVEKKSHSVIAEMEKTLGEPLQKYF